MTVSVLFLVGRFLFTVPFVMLGVDRVLAPERSTPEKAWAALGLVGAAGVVLGVYGDLAAWVLAVAVLGGGIVECSAPDADDETRLRLVGLLGGAICVMALYAAVGSAIDFTVTDPALDLDLR